MKKKLIFSIIIFTLLIVGIIYANSYVQALSRREINNKGEIYKDREGININCYNYCEPYEECPVYQQNGNCTRRNSQSSQRNYHCNRDYNRGICHR